MLNLEIVIVILNPVSRVVPFIIAKGGAAVQATSVMKTINTTTLDHSIIEVITTLQSPSEK